MAPKEIADRRYRGRGHSAPVAAGIVAFLPLLLLFTGFAFSRSLPADTTFAAPDTASFGYIRVRACDTIRLPLRNNGAEPVVVDSLRLTTAHSSLTLIDSSGNVVVGSRSSVTIRIGFCPSDTACARGELYVYGHSTGAGEPAIVHRVGIGGCGGIPVGELDRDRIDFGSVLIGKCERERFTVTNSGNYPLRIAGVKPLGGAFAITDPGTFPIVVPPRASRGMEIGFCPLDTAQVLDSVVLVTDAENDMHPIHLTGSGRLKELSMPFLFDVGSTWLGKCIDTFLVAKNTGTVSVTITAVALAAHVMSGFSLISTYPTGWERTLSPGDMFHIPLRFCPAEEGEGRDSLSITDEGGDATPVIIIGRGIVPVLRLDTTDMEAGQIGSLTLRIGPDDPAGPGHFRVRLSFPAHALQPTEVTPADPGIVLRMTRSAGDTFLIEGDRTGDPAADGALFDLSFRGLSSGDPLNVVRIEDFEFPDPAIRWSARHGLVRLSGCDVGRTPVRGKRAHIKAIGPNPAGGSATVTYQAPAGRRPTLALFDGRGSRVTSVELPEGTDGPQQYRLDFGDLSEGLYLIELREREERSWSILLIDR